MFQDKFISSQLVSFLDKNHFNYLARKFEGDKYVKYFTCWTPCPNIRTTLQQKSLRDLIVALKAHQSKCYHLGMGSNPIAKTIFATANQNRDYRIFEEFVFYDGAGTKEAY